MFFVVPTVLTQISFAQDGDQGNPVVLWTPARLAEFSHDANQRLEFLFEEFDELTFAYKVEGIWVETPSKNNSKKTKLHLMFLPFSELLLTSKKDYRTANYQSIQEYFKTEKMRLSISMDKNGNWDTQLLKLQNAPAPEQGEIITRDREWLDFNKRIVKGHLPVFSPHLKTFDKLLHFTSRREHYWFQSKEPWLSSVRPLDDNRSHLAPYELRFELHPEQPMPSERPLEAQKRELRSVLNLVKYLISQRIQPAFIQKKAKAPRRSTPNNGYYINPKTMSYKSAAPCAFVFGG
jgi:hypothetical protein